MTNPARKEDSELKREQKEKHKQSHERRKLRKNRHNVWVGVKEND